MLDQEVPASILIVEDERSLVDAIRYTLEREGYRVVPAYDGREGLSRFHESVPSLVLLDLMLPVMSGLDVCQRMRSESSVPILMLTAKDGEADKIVGLEIGADDYITKPFSIHELLSRVRAHLRRASMMQQVTGNTKLVVGSLKMDCGSHQVTLDGRDLFLPPKEFALLEALMEGAGKLLTRQTLIRQVWGSDYYGDTRTLDVHIKRLRAKIEVDPHQPRKLTTVRGLGYKLEPD